LSEEKGGGRRTERRNWIERKKRDEKYIYPDKMESRKAFASEPEIGRTQDLQRGENGSILGKELIRYMEGNQDNAVKTRRVNRRNRDRGGQLGSRKREEIRTSFFGKWGGR